MWTWSNINKQLVDVYVQPGIDISCFYDRVNIKSAMDHKLSYVRRRGLWTTPRKLPYPTYAKLANCLPPSPFSNGGKSARVAGNMNCTLYSDHTIPHRLWYTLLHCKKRLGKGKSLTFFYSESSANMGRNIYLSHSPLLLAFLFGIRGSQDN